MDTSVMITLGFLVFAIVMFAWEKIPLSITAMIVAVGLHLSGVLSAKDAFAGLGSFGFFDYGLVGLPILIVGTIFYATIGKRFLPDAPSHQPDGAFEGNDDYSHVPSWKKWISALVLILTVVAMIFEKQLGVKLYVSAWVGALVLVATNVISETAAVKSIDMKTIMLFAGSNRS